SFHGVFWRLRSESRGLCGRPTPSSPARLLYGCHWYRLSAGCIVLPPIVCGRKNSSGTASSSSMMRMSGRAWYSLALITPVAALRDRCGEFRLSLPHRAENAMTGDPTPPPPPRQQGGGDEPPGAAWEF